MGAGIVTSETPLSYPWQNATQGAVGFGVALTANEQVNLATVKTHVPYGVLLNAPKLGEFATVEARAGRVVEAVCGAAITAAYPILVTVTVDATGRFITAVKTATPGAVNWVWGFAMKSTTAAGQKFPLLLHFFEMDIT